MTLLTRLTTVGLSKETTQGTYVAPVRFSPQSGFKPEDIVAPLRDESIKGNDAVVQGIYGGPAYSTCEWTTPHLYPDIVGDYFRAILGPDTVTNGVNTTLSSSSSIGATTISTAASIPTDSTISIGTGSTQEFAVTTNVTGAGPYTITVPALTYAHASAQPVVSLYTHTFKQDNRAAVIPTYSITWYDVVETRGYPGSTCSDLAIKIDPKGAVTADPKWTGWPSANQSNTAATFSGAQPFLGWQWTFSINGVNSTRGISAEVTFKRATAPIDSSDGTQGPREVWAGALECDFKFKCIFENNTDFTTFQGYQAAPIVLTLTKPTSFGGESLVLTSSAQKFTKFAADTGSDDLMADMEGSAVFNTTDNGVASIALKNYVTSQY